MRSLADWLALPGRTARALAFAALLACAFGRPAVAQAPEPTLSALERWLALDVPTGDETRATDAIRAADPGWRRDVLGNLVRRAGQGRPRRLVACGLDHVGFVVSAITEDGYLRLHRAGNAATHPLWDQSHQGQQVRVLGARGAIPGVVAIANAHFARQHRGDTVVVGVDQLWVDVGARSRAEAERLGVALLDPVRRDHPPWCYGALVAGADASGRAGCAAVAAAGRETPAAGETVYLLSVQRATGWAGLAAAVARLGPFDQVVVAGPAELPAEGGPAATGVARVVADGPAVRRRVLRAGAPDESEELPAGVDSLVRLDVRARFAGALVESVAAADADSLLAAVRLAAGLAPNASGPGWVLPAAAMPGAATRPAGRTSRDALAGVAALLDSLIVLPGVPRHEAAVRAAVRAALPGWARERAEVDSAGNLIVAAGPDRDTTLVVAHMDEVAWTVASIAADGSVALEAQGGVIPSAWEGQPAVLHFDMAPNGTAAAPLPGVFVPRASATLRRPEAVRAWFGLDSAALVARGVRVGLGVTATKRGERLGATRFTARALDDRAGSTALVLAARALDPARLTRKVILAWSVQEEIGVFGASALARRLGASVRRAYAIDTFVSSDTPLEAPTFAYTPLGAGPVLRGVDDGLVARRDERARVRRIAAAAGIPLQVGTTHGATDATPFVAAGAPGMGLSWPGRYSHSPAEVLDLRDLAALARLIGAVITAP